MLSKLGKTVKRHELEIVISIALFLLAIALLFWTLGSQKDTFSAHLGEKLSLALLVALVSRWLTIWFSGLAPKEDLYASSFIEYHDALQKAHSRIWIAQTYLPGLDRESEEVLEHNVGDLRILLASLKPGAPIYPRLSGRSISVDDAKIYIKTSALPFVNASLKKCVRFAYGHHPGWIAVVDSSVFWGPTPVQVDNHSRDIFFHKDTLNGAKAAFWIDQFEELWRHHSHDYDEEKKYNETLVA